MIQNNFTGIVPSNSRKRSLDTFFNEKVKMILGRKTIDSPGMKVPSMTTHPNEFKIELALPGYSPDQVAVYVYNDVLRLAIRDRDETVDIHKKGDSRSFSYNALDFEYALPEGSNVEELRATYDSDSGVLEIVIPRDSGNIKRTSKKIAVEQPA